MNCLRTSSGGKPRLLHLSIDKYCANVLGFLARLVTVYKRFAKAGFLTPGRCPKKTRKDGNGGYSDGP